MAAPPEIKLGNLSGDWVMNKTLSDDPDPVLALQGVGWMKRKIIGMATVTLHVKQYDEDGKTHIDIDQTATGGIKGTTELRTLNWEPKSHKDDLFGSLTGKSRWSSQPPDFPGLDEAHINWLQEGWLDDGEEAGPNGEKRIESYSASDDNGWVADQIWGFAEVEGKRFYVRRVVIKKGDKVLKIRMVYDWQGKK